MLTSQYITNELLNNSDEDDNQPYQAPSLHNSKAIEPHHLAEWVDGSAVKEEIARLNIESLKGQAEIASFLGWNAYKHTPGWVVRGVNPRTGEKMGDKFGQFKPDKPIQFPDKEKPAKYLTPKGTAYDALCLNMEFDGCHAVWNGEYVTSSKYWPDIIANPNIPIAVTEGAKKAGAGLSVGVPTIALFGVEMGLTSLASGTKVIVPNLEPFAVPGRIIYLPFDQDLYEKPEVRSALKRLANRLEKKGATVLVPSWDNKYKGMDDFIKANGGEAFRDALTNSQTVKNWEKQFKSENKSNSSDNTGEKRKIYPEPPPSDEMGERIAEEYRDRLAYNNENGTWYRYEADFKGVWSPETEEYIEAIVAGILRGKGIRGWDTRSYLTNTLKSMRDTLIERKWLEKPANEFLPFENGVLEVATGKLLPHSPGYRFTWSLPRHHNPLSTDWLEISDWMDTATGKNQQLKNVLVAFAAATLKGMGHLQKFLHLIGIGGSGKGTFMKLLVNLIGLENTHTTTLEEWCGNRFETAQAYRKRLVIFPDEDKGTRGLSRFKSLTGGDWLRAEEKMKKPFKFKFDGMVALASNFPIFSGDSSSGMSRRTISVPFNAVIAQTRRRDLEKVFQPELAAFTNYLLNLENDWIERTLKGIADVPEISLQFWENQIRENPIAGFLNDKLIYDPTAQTQVGDSPEAEGSLYAAYALYCKAQGHSPKAIKNFSPDLLELCQITLGWQVEKVHTKVGKVIRGLRVRTAADAHIGTWDFELKEKCDREKNDGDGCGDGLVTGMVTGQNVDTVSILEKVTDKTLFSEEIQNEIFDASENKPQFSGESTEIYPSPQVEIPNSKGFDSSPPPITNPSPNPSPEAKTDLKIGDRVQIIDVTSRYLNEGGTVTGVREADGWLKVKGHGFTSHFDKSSLTKR